MTDQYFCDNSECNLYLKTVDPTILGNPDGPNNHELICPACDEPVREDYDSENNTDDLISEYSYGDYETDGY